MSSQDGNNSKETNEKVPQTVEDIGKDHIGSEVEEKPSNITISEEKKPVKEDELKEDGDKAEAKEKADGNIVHHNTVNNENSQEFDDGGSKDNIKVEVSQDIEKDEVRLADGEESLTGEVGDFKPDENVDNEALGYGNGSDDDEGDQGAGSHEVGNHEEGDEGAGSCEVGNHEEGGDGEGKEDLNQQIGEEDDEEVGEYEKGEDMDYDEEDEQEGDVDTGESDGEGDDYEEEEEVDYGDEKEGDMGDGNGEVGDNEEGKIAVDDGEDERDVNQQESDKEEDDYEEGEIVDDEDEDVIVEEEEENDGKEVEKKDEMEEDDCQETEEIQKEPERKVTSMRFWAHDNRWMDGYEEERSKARNRKLWDKTDVKWEHDLYVEADQGPKTKEELEESRHFVDSMKNRGRGRRTPRMLKDFVIEGDRARFGRRRNQGDKNQNRGGRNDRNRSRKDYESLKNESQQRRENNKEIENENTENRDEQTRPRQSERNQRREGSQRETMGGESSYNDRRGRDNDNAGFNRRKGFDRLRKQEGANDDRDRNRETEGGSKGLERDTRGQHRDRQRKNRRSEEEREGFDQDTRGHNRDRQHIDRTNEEGKERFDQDTRGRNRDRERGDGDKRTEEDNKRHDQNTRGRNRGDRRTNEDKEGFDRGNTRDRPRGFGNRDDFKRKEKDYRRGRDSDARAGMQRGGFGRPGDKKREEKEENWEEDLHERKNKETESGGEREVKPERFKQRDDNNDNTTRNNDRSPKEDRQESVHETKEERRGRKPRSPEGDGSPRRRSDERREEMNDRRRRRRTTSDRSDGEDEEKKQAAQKTAKAEKQESIRNKGTSSDARGTRKWSEMRTKAVGRGRPLNKPKKTAADFAREVELERRKSEELAAEEVAAVVETERFTNAGSGDEPEDQEVQEHGGEVFQNENPAAPEPASSGSRKRYSAQRQKPAMATTVQPPLQPVAIPESAPRETQLVYVTPHSFPPMYYAPQPTLQTQEINPSMLRPMLIQNGHYAMGPPRNAPPGEYVQNIPPMQPEQYDHSQNFADPNTGMIYPPQQFSMMQPFMPQQVYHTDLPHPPGYYQQNIPAPPRQGSPQSLPTMQPAHPVLVQTGQASSGRKRTSAIPIKSPQNEEQL